jgi:molybdenum cofactor guanylyltransferase
MTRSAIVLCGGLSSRMGRPKALLPWRGRTLVEHVVATLRPLVDDVVVVTSHDLDVPPLDAAIVRDREPKLGPLSGLRDGLAAVRGDLAFATATDAPYLTPEFVRALFAFGRAAAPEIDGFVQPLSAVYPRALAAVAGDLIAAGRMRLLHLLEAADFRRVRADELPEVESTRNLNTPEDYLAAVRRDDPAARVNVELFGLLRTTSGAERMQVGPGALGEVLGELESALPMLRLRRDGEVAKNLLVSLNGQTFVRDAALPIGPGDSVLLMDAAVGG